MLSGLPRNADPNLLVGSETSDDAGVYRIGPGLALVQTVDFFPPMVDDPSAFGRIAAANALSDVYAMGGAPLTALNIVGWPKGLGLALLGTVLAGGREKLDEAGCALVGGHSVVDAEVKFGMAVTGTVDPARMTTNAGARPGDRILLTKPLGTGIVTTALKFGKASPGEAEAAVASMSALNRAASEAMVAAGVLCATDVTGFGLLGHAAHVARESKVALSFRASALPLLPGAARHAGKGIRTGAYARTKEHLGACARVDPRAGAALEAIVFDAETSGGLLIFTPPVRAASLIEDLRRRSVDAREVGEAHAPRADGVRLEVLP